MRQCEIECETSRKKKAVRCDGRIICNHCNSIWNVFLVCDLAVVEWACEYVVTMIDGFKQEGEGRGGYREDA